MCHYQTLFHDDDLGYVVQCNECEKIQLGYGNMVITFSMDDFAAFHQWLLRVRGEQDPQISAALRCILIPTPCEGMKLLLSRRELDEFILMLETADSELQSLALLKLFSVE